MKKYITTAIPYPNSAPHVGTVMDHLYADIWARYNENLGHQVRFQAGLDENANKVAQKAAQNGMNPQDYIDQLAPVFEGTLTKLNINNTDFIRTTSKEHKLRAQYIWRQLSPYIYKSRYQGWYCQGCENFVTNAEATANGGICPDHKTNYTQLDEENYYLKVSAMTEKLREALENNVIEIIPEYRKTEFLNFIKDGLADVSISRPKKSVDWGVEVPDDPDHVMYVWIDALSNYLTVIGYPDDDTWKEYWPPSVQIIGKDIIRFHIGIQLAMHMMLGLPLPKKMLAHGFIQVKGDKISKSLGNVISPDEVVDKYGVDAFRYYFSRHVPTYSDGDFTWEKFENAYNNELGNDLGNLVQRVASMIVRYQSGVIGEVPSGEHDMRIYERYMDSLEYNKAMDEVWNLIRSMNQYLEQVKPWQIAKESKENPEAADHLADVLGHAVGGLRQVATMVAPFLPHTSANIYAIFENDVINESAVKPLFEKKYYYTQNPREKSHK